METGIIPFEAVDALLACECSLDELESSLILLFTAFV
jgi:hypothetical protein